MGYKDTENDEEHCSIRIQSEFPLNDQVNSVECKICMWELYAV